MASTERNILSRIQTDIASVDGSGSYHFDFSASDQVVLALAMQPLKIPGAYISPVSLRTIQSAGRTVMTRYDRQMIVQVDAFVPTTNDSPGTAILAAMDAQSDLMKALENDRALGGLVHDLEIEGSAYDGHELDLQRVGVASLRITINYSEVAGA